MKREGFERARGGVFCAPWVFASAEGADENRIPPSPPNSLLSGALSEPRVISPGAPVIDLRSVSRVGGGDLGANAKRIRRFIAAYGAPP